MARRKGLKRWDEITTEGWLSLMADKTVMSALMMQIFSRLYHSEDYMDNAKNIAKALHLEYRALNAGVGWAGNKIREMYESGGLLTYHASEKKDETPREEETGEFRLSETPASRVRRSPWEYVFDGSEDDNGTYFWVLKPEAVRAYREIMDADIWHLDDIRQLLESDETAYGCEGSLFSHSSSHTVDEPKAVFKKCGFQKKIDGGAPLLHRVRGRSNLSSPCGPLWDARRVTKGAHALSDPCGTFLRASHLFFRCGRASGVSSDLRKGKEALWSCRGREGEGTFQPQADAYASKNFYRGRKKTEMILSGKEIVRHMGEEIIIDPFDPKRVNPNSYNLTLSDELMVYDNYELDMKKRNEGTLLHIPEEGYVLQPNKLYLGRTHEYTKTRCFVPMLEGRSSIGRLGLFIHVTAGFGDVGFSGYWTLEMFCVQPIRIYAGVEICQIYFHTVLGEADRYDSGKYQNNKGIQPSLLYKDFEK